MAQMLGHSGQLPVPAAVWVQAGASHFPLFYSKRQAFKFPASLALALELLVWGPLEPSICPSPHRCRNRPPAVSKPVEHRRWSCRCVVLSPMVKTRASANSPATLKTGIGPRRPMSSRTRMAMRLAGCLVCGSGSPGGKSSSTGQHDNYS